MSDALASSSQAKTESGQPAASEVPANQRRARSRRGSRAAVIRMCVLFGVLAALLFALWYDYKVARVGVDRAYVAVGALNQLKNSAAEHVVMSRTDVRQTLGRSPTRVFQEGYVTIEEYGWAAGFPIEFRGLYSENPEVALRTHNYYAVYLGNRFSTHYKFFLPLHEIRAAQEIRPAGATGSSDPPMNDAADYYAEMTEAYMRRGPGSVIPDAPPDMGGLGPDPAFAPALDPAFDPTFDGAAETRAPRGESPAESSIDPSPTENAGEP